MSEPIHRGNFTLNVNFNLRKTKPAHEATAINAVVRFNNERVVISGIDKIEPRFWNNEKQIPKQHAANTRAKSISTNISDAKSIITKIFEDYTKRLNEYPKDVKEFQKQCRRRIFNLPDEGDIPVAKKTTNLLEYLECLRDDIKEGRRVISTGKSKGQPYASNSYKSYGTLLSNLKKYMEFARIKELHFDDIDLDFYTNFRDYIVVKKSQAPGTFGTMIKCLKTTLNDAAEYGLHSNTKHKSRNFIKEPSNADTIFLDNDKLDHLFKLDLSDNPRLEKVRDLFLVGAYSGARHGDYSTIRPQDIQGDFIKIKTQKTNQRVTIPITTNLRAILNKYDNKLPEGISNQKFNIYLKEVAELAGFDDRVQVTKYKNGKEIVETVPFFSLVSSHSARRSFCTNMFKMGIPSILIMAISGHTTEKSFLSYIRMDNDDKAKMMLELIRRNELKVINAGVK